MLAQSVSQGRIKPIVLRGSHKHISLVSMMFVPLCYDSVATAEVNATSWSLWSYSGFTQCSWKQYLGQNLSSYCWFGEKWLSDQFSSSLETCCYHLLLRILLKTLNLPWTRLLFIKSLPMRLTWWIQLVCEGEAYIGKEEFSHSHQKNKILDLIHNYSITTISCWYKFVGFHWNYSIDLCCYVDGCCRCWCIIA